METIEIPVDVETILKDVPKEHVSDKLGEEFIIAVSSNCLAIVLNDPPQSPSDVEVLLFGNDKKCIFLVAETPSNHAVMQEFINKCYQARETGIPYHCEINGIWPFSFL